MGVYLFTDIHGNLSAYEQCKQYIGDDTLDTDEKHIVLCLGDLIDRGPKSCKIVNNYVELLKNNRYSDIKCYFIIGNHEYYLYSYLQHGTHLQTWLTNGGYKILDELGGSFGDTLTFCKNFAQLFIYGYGCAYIMAKHLYVCSHAGPYTHVERNIDNMGRELGKSPHRMKRLESRMDHYKIFNTHGDEEKKVFTKKRMGGFRLDNDHRKYHVYGHSVIPTQIIDFRWNNENIYNNYEKKSMMLLPMDTGVGGGQKQVAIGELLKNEQHKLTLKPIATQIFDRDYLLGSGNEDKYNKYVTKAGRLKKIWKELVVYNSINEKDKKKMQGALSRNLLISWKKDWINLREKYEQGRAVTKESAKKYYSTTLEPLDSPEVKNTVASRVRALDSYFKIRSLERDSLSCTRSKSKLSKLSAALYAKVYLTSLDRDLDTGVNVHYDSLNQGRLKKALLKCKEGPELLKALRDHKSGRRR